ncbi:hypothetical protein [Pararhizobium sp.]|uniref:hypothetical protein n=1 Tax=Pararhizobium sp. TaxID=1977563 RepID=UPI003D0CE3BC
MSENQKMVKTIMDMAKAFGIENTNIGPSLDCKTEELQQHAVKHIEESLNQQQAANTGQVPVTLSWTEDNMPRIDELFWVAGRPVARFSPSRLVHKDNEVLFPSGGVRLIEPDAGAAPLLNSVWYFTLESDSKFIIRDLTYDPIHGFLYEVSDLRDLSGTGTSSIAANKLGISCAFDGFFKPKQPKQPKMPDLDEWFDKALEIHRSKI